MRLLGIMSISAGLVFFIMDMLPRGDYPFAKNDIQSIGYFGIALVIVGLVVLAIDHIKGKEKGKRYKIEDKIVVKKRPKSPVLAGVLAFLFPFGVGPLYNGQYWKALISFFIFAGLVTLQTSGHNQPFLGLCLVGFIFYQILDSVLIAKNINRRFFQQDEKVI